MVLRVDFPGLDDEKGSTSLFILFVFIAALVIGGLSFYDWDSDGLRNYKEWTGSTVWRNPDTDRDGGLDGEEVNIFGTDPTVPQDVYSVSKTLKQDGGLTEPEIDYVKKIIEEPGFKSLAENYRLHQDGVVTQPEISYLERLKDDNFRSLALQVDLHRDQDVNSKELEYLSILQENPDTRPQIIEVGFHKDAKITQKELSLFQDSDGDGRIDYLEEKFPTVTYALEKGLPENVANQLKPLDEDETISDLEKVYVDFLDRSLHNIRPQILEAGFHQDGKITENDLSLMKDSDEDGLIDYMENRIGTDPQNKDTDNDQLLDGWEVYGVKRKGHEPVPLDEYGANPLKKDIFVEIIGESLPKDVKDKVTQVFANAPVDNGEGINLHIDDDTSGYSLGGQNVSFENIEKYADKGAGSWRINETHPRFGTFHFGKVYRIGSFAQCPGWNFTIGKDATGASDVVTHELGHNILGYLDENNQIDSGKYSEVHSKYKNYTMWPSHPVPNATYHPNVWEEIDRDGTLGLPSLADWKIFYSGEG